MYICAEFWPGYIACASKELGNSLLGRERNKHWMLGMITYSWTSAPNFQKIATCIAVVGLGPMILTMVPVSALWDILVEQPAPLFWPTISPI